MALWEPRILFAFTLFQVSPAQSHTLFSDLPRPVTRTSYITPHNTFPKLLRSSIMLNSVPLFSNCHLMRQSNV
ncbi:hypothetical protein BC827DRAFT_1247667 [Russula dissimulans]|nr:hypothetical protein BC827DRAFT_1247667 [Russula dissimulans]